MHYNIAYLSFCSLFCHSTFFFFEIYSCLHGSSGSLTVTLHSIPSYEYPILSFIHFLTNGYIRLFPIFLLLKKNAALYISPYVY